MSDYDSSISTIEPRHSSTSPNNVASASRKRILFHDHLGNRKVPHRFCSIALHYHRSPTGAPRCTYCLRTFLILYGDSVFFSSLSFANQTIASPKTKTQDGTTWVLQRTVYQDNSESPHYGLTVTLWYDAVNLFVVF